MRKIFVALTAFLMLFSCSDPEPAAAEEPSDEGTLEASEEASEETQKRLEELGY